MQRVLAGIDANRADGCDVCLEGHGGVLLVLLSLRSLSERFGAGARPVHPILGHRPISGSSQKICAEVTGDTLLSILTSRSR
jgi:hypothetical protein